MTEPPPKRSSWWWILGAAIVLIVLGNLLIDDGDSSKNRTASTTTTTPSHDPNAWDAPPRDKPPPPPSDAGTRNLPAQASSNDYDSIPANGTHQMGGMDGKNWGVWSATAAGDCTWSVRAVFPDAPGEVLQEGTATAGERVRVVINPPGDVDLDGMVDDTYRLVFMTSGCGPWTRGVQ